MKIKKIKFKKSFCSGYNKNGIYIEKGVKVFAGASVWFGNVIKGESEVGSNCELLPHNYIEGAKIGENCTVGPFARLRKESVIGRNCKIGNFVEIKNSHLGKNVKIAHLTYVGDAEIGDNCNLGCGVVFCNYDGKNKHKCKVGQNVFVGSNSNLIAPLVVGDDCFIGAGTTVTEDLECGSFAIGRVKQKVRQNKFIKDIAEEQ